MHPSIHTYIYYNVIRSAWFERYPLRLIIVVIWSFFIYNDLRDTLCNLVCSTFRTIPVPIPISPTVCNSGCMYQNALTCKRERKTSHLTPTKSLTKHPKQLVEPIPPPKQTLCSYSLINQIIWGLPRFIHKKFARKKEGWLKSKCALGNILFSPLIATGYLFFLIITNTYQCRFSSHESS